MNALCQCADSDWYNDIYLAVFADRSKIWNSGVFLKKRTTESFKHTHESGLRNKLIANLFYVRGFLKSGVVVQIR